MLYEVITASVNVNINRGNVDKLAEGVNGLYNSEWGGTAYVEPGSGDYVLEEGKPVGQVRGFQYDGWYKVDDFNYENGQYVLKDGIADIASGILGPVYGTTSNKPRITSYNVCYTKLLRGHWCLVLL